MNEGNDKWNRCDICGKFISYNDFENGAIRKLIEPDSDYSTECWETLCRIHAVEELNSKLNLYQFNLCDK